MFFFASPKKNQKKSPAKDYSPFAGGSYVQLLYYCDFGIFNATPDPSELEGLVLNLAEGLR